MAADPLQHQRHQGGVSDREYYHSNAGSTPLKIKEKPTKLGKLTTRPPYWTLGQHKALCSSLDPGLTQTSKIKMAAERSSISIFYLCHVAVLFRVILIVYGEWQDKTMLVKYTDIDYHVFTDAARSVYNGGSPYERATYRYTPLLALVLTPNISLHGAFGKVLFLLFDVLTGYLLYRIQIARGFHEKTSVLSACFWLFNPVAATISSRGNAESVMAFLVLATLYAALKNRPLLTAVFLALAVHFKIFPIMYSLPLFLFIGATFDKTFPGNAKELLVRLIGYVLHTSRIKLVFGFILTIGGVTSLLYYR